MDRRRTLGLVTLGATLLAGAAYVAVQAAAPLRAADWLAKGHEPVRALGLEPGECLQKPRNPVAAASVEIGRAAFRAPLVLGGQGARAGLSCESCHRNGHGNPDFAFPGLSDKAGTADVTSSITSEHRGDGVFNPRPIPSLLDTGGPHIASRDPSSRDLENFIHGLVTEEFDGPEPPPAVLEGLADYVRALKPGACRAPATRPVTLAARMDDVDRAVRAAQRALAAGDRPTARVMLASARSGLGLVAERYAAPALKADLAAITAAAAELGRLQNDLGAGQTRVRLAAWPTRLDALERRLARNERQSLFDRRRLVEAFAR